jgi:hypothetical protein
MLELREVVDMLPEDFGATSDPPEAEYKDPIQPSKSQQQIKVFPGVIPIMSRFKDVRHKGVRSTQKTLGLIFVLPQ